MSFSTNVAPGAAGYRNCTMVVAISTDGRIFYNWWLLGEGGHGWRELEGNGRTDAAPAASFVEKSEIVNDSDFYELDMWSAVKGLDHNIYTNASGGFGGAFNGWVLLPGLQTNVALAATVTNNGVDPIPIIGEYLPVTVATATDGRIFYNTSLAEPVWVELEGNGRTDVAPAAALVGDKGTYLFVAVKGLDGQLYLNQGELGRPFVGWQQL